MSEKKPKDYTIYGLVASLELVYVGCTVNLKARLSGHRSKYGKEICAVVLEKTNDVEREWAWIQFFREDLGMALLNAKGHSTYYKRPLVPKLQKISEPCIGTCLNDKLMYALCIHPENQAAIRNSGLDDRSVTRFLSRLSRRQLATLNIPTQMQEFLAATSA
jgi:hypothetical protein